MAGAHTLLAFIREDESDLRGALTERGYVEVLREREYALDVTRFDFAPYRDLAARLRKLGIAIRSLPELADDPDWYVGDYEFQCPIVVVTHERDIRSIVGREVTLVDGRIVADEDQHAGVSA